MWDMEPLDGGGFHMVAGSIWSHGQAEIRKFVAEAVVKLVPQLMAVLGRVHPDLFHPLLISAIFEAVKAFDGYHPAVANI